MSSSRLGVPLRSPGRARLVSASRSCSQTAPSSPLSDKGTAGPSRTPAASRTGSGASAPRTLHALVRARTPDALSAPAGSPSKRILAPSTRVHLLPDKLEQSRMDALRQLVAQLGALNVSLDYATVVLSEIRAPKRAERALGEEAKSRGVPVLHHSWLDACLEAGIQVPHEAYQIWPPVSSTPAAASTSTRKRAPSTEADDVRAGKHARAEKTLDLRDAATAEDDDHDEAYVALGGYGSAEEEGGYGSHEEGTLPSMPRLDKGKGKAAERSPSRRDSASPTPPPPTISYSGPVPQWQNSANACFRPTPLVSMFNQALVAELEVIRVSRVLSEKNGARDQHNSAAYGRAISAIKAYPHPLAKDPKKAKEIAGVGAKIYKAVLQFYELGYVAEARAIRADSSHAIMKSFLDFYGVGPAGARKAYQQGARSLKDLCALGGSYSDRLGREECLRILPDLLHRIPRAECEAIAKLIHEEFEKLHPGMKYTICGGYRRGKATSGDVDVVISPDLERAPVGELKSLKKQTEMLHQVLEALKKRAIMTHVVSVAQPSEYYGEAIVPHCDIAEIVVLPPALPSDPAAASADAKRPRYRRVDIILTRPEVYGATVLGWTGSKQFEKDIRRQARQLGYKFHSTGLVRLDAPKVTLDTPEEEDIFELLGVPYMPPHLRNCDA